MLYTLPTANRRSHERTTQLDGGAIRLQDGSNALKRALGALRQEMIEETEFMLLRAGSHGSGSGEQGLASPVFTGETNPDIAPRPWKTNTKF
jgi:hypothetical protein